MRSLSAGQGFCALVAIALQACSVACRVSLARVFPRKALDSMQGRPWWQRVIGGIDMGESGRGSNRNVIA